MISGIDLFRVTGDRMRYLTERQTVIARNIANADTPDYKAQDLAPFNPTAPAGTQSAAGGAVSLARTNQGHLALASDTGTSLPLVDSGTAYGEKPDGNTVSVEEQMLHSADVANAFALASSTYAKAVSLMKMAIGNP